MIARFVCFVNDFARLKNDALKSEKGVKSTHYNIKSNKFTTFCNMAILTYMARFVTI